MLIYKMMQHSVKKTLKILIRHRVMLCPIWVYTIFKRPIKRANKINDINNRAVVKFEQVRCGDCLLLCFVDLHHPEISNENSRSFIFSHYTTNAFYKSRIR